MSDNSNWRIRANQAGDAFRVLCAGAASAIVLAGVALLNGNGVKNDLADLVWVAQVAALVALFMLGLSWLLQKAKALAEEGRPDDTPLWLTNQIFDVLAFSSLLFAMALLIFRGPLSLVVAAAFVAAVACVEFLVTRWRPRPRNTGLSRRLPQ